ncbi:MAG: metalloregulator ArsR/SmtB family transcription factor [Gemmatimonas sp.]|nr:metalloregulator ArsR/SmtB family transcription factor [Gemmatimonas sp.]
MVNYLAGLDAVFLALADPTRRGMIERLSRGPATVGELGRPFAMTKPAITKHVRTLEQVGLVRRERIGRIHRCTLAPEAMRDAEEWIERHRRFWKSSLDRLTRHVESGDKLTLALTEERDE